MHSTASEPFAKMAFFNAAKHKQVDYHVPSRHPGDESKGWFNSSMSFGLKPIPLANDMLRIDYKGFFADIQPLFSDSLFRVSSQLKESTLLNVPGKSLDALLVAKVQNLEKLQSEEFRSQIGNYLKQHVDGAPLSYEMPLKYILVDLALEHAFDTRRVNANSLNTQAQVGEFFFESFFDRKITEWGKQCEEITTCFKALCLSNEAGLAGQKAEVFANAFNGYFDRPGFFVKEPWRGEVLNKQTDADYVQALEGLIQNEFEKSNKGQVFWEPELGEDPWGLISHLRNFDAAKNRLDATRDELERIQNDCFKVAPPRAMDLREELDDFLQAGCNPQTRPRTADFNRYLTQKARKLEWGNMHYSVEPRTFPGFLCNLLYGMLRFGYAYKPCKECGRPFFLSAPNSLYCKRYVPGTNICCSSSERATVNQGKSSSSQLNPKVISLRKRASSRCNEEAKDYYETWALVVQKIGNVYATAPSVSGKLFDEWTSKVVPSKKDVVPCEGKYPRPIIWDDEIIDGNSMVTVTSGGLSGYPEYREALMDEIREYPDAQVQKKRSGRLTTWAKLPAYRLQQAVVNFNAGDKLNGGKLACLPIPGISVDTFNVIFNGADSCKLHTDCGAGSRSQMPTHLDKGELGDVR